jgi:hypothetical protein
VDDYRLSPYCLSGLFDAGRSAAVEQELRLILGEKQQVGAGG